MLTILFIFRKLMILISKFSSKQKKQNWQSAVKFTQVLYKLLHPERLSKIFKGQIREAEKVVKETYVHLK